MRAGGKFDLDIPAATLALNEAAVSFDDANSRWMVEGTVTTVRPLVVDLREFEPRWPEFQPDVLKLRVDGVPIAWMSRFVPQLRITSGTLHGELDGTVPPDRSLHVAGKVPFEVRDASLVLGDLPVMTRGRVRVSPSIVLARTSLEMNLERIELRDETGHRFDANIRVRSASRAATSFGVDFRASIPSVEDFNKGLMTAIELSGSADQREYEKTGTMVNLTQNFKSMLDSLRIIRDNSNAVRNYLKSAKDAGQAIVAPNVNTLNNTSTNQSLNIGDHFKQIRNQSGNFVSQLVLLREVLVTGALADLSDRIQKFHELSDQIRPVLDKIKEEDKKATDLVGNMSRLLEQANSYLGNIEGVKNKSTEINSNSEAALNEINAKLAKIRETTTEAEKLRTQVDQYQSQYKAFDEELTAGLNRFKEFDKANTEAQEKNSEREKEIDKITEKSNQMLRGATNAGLARAFYAMFEMILCDGANHIATGNLIPFLYQLGKNSHFRSCERPGSDTPLEMKLPLFSARTGRGRWIPS